MPSQNFFSPKCDWPKISLTPINTRSRRNYSSNLIKSKAKENSPKITRPGSMSPVEVITFLEEHDEEAFTEDWANSLLYKKITSGENLELEMKQQEIKVVSRKPPKDHGLIEIIINKGMGLLKMLLMELLGTKEDMMRFEEKFKPKNRRTVRTLMERCFNLITIRNLTIEILVEINKREIIMKNLKSSKNHVKEKIVKIYQLNKIIREKIQKWGKEEEVPFKTFFFKGKDYLIKIAEDNIVLQQYLSSNNIPKLKK